MIYILGDIVRKGWKYDKWEISKIIFCSTGNNQMFPVEHEFRLNNVYFSSKQSAFIAS